MLVIDSFLSAQGFLVLDGGLATELEARGLRLDDRLWSAAVLLEQPEQVQRLHADYLEAGADCVISASYQASVQGLVEAGLCSVEAEQVLRRSVGLACAARDEFWESSEVGGERLRPLVAASVGPYGAYLADGSEYRGDDGLSEQELMDFHRPRFEILCDAGADLLACETIPSHREARALAHLIEQTPGVSAWFSFQARDGGRISDGTEIRRIVAELEPVDRIEAIGVNCTEPRFVPDLVKAVAAESTKPIVVYPNSGEGWDAASRCWTEADEQPGLGEAAASWHQLGARLIGGCCRTGPETIRSIRNRLERESNNRG